jgi:hypothetical protein
VNVQSSTQLATLAMVRELGLRDPVPTDERLCPGGVIVRHPLGYRLLAGVLERGYRVAPSGRLHVIIEPPR